MAIKKKTTKKKAPAKKTAAKKKTTVKKAPAKALKVPTSDTVTLKNITMYLAETHELTKKQMTIIMDDLVEALVANLKKGKRVRMAGLGILQVKKRAARMGRNPATGETIKIKASKKVAFRASKDLKEAVGNKRK